MCGYFMPAPTGRTVDSMRIRNFTILTSYAQGPQAYKHCQQETIVMQQ